MADPQIINCPADEWVLVAQNVTHGQVHRYKRGIDYLQTYRNTGNPAPPDNESDGVIITTDSIEIRSTDPIDVYIRARQNDGEVRVDV